MRNRVLIGAPASGSGKTSITCGLLNILNRRGYKVMSYKCGPDYIDPMFHRKVIGINGDNLDTCFVSDEYVRKIVASSENEYGVMEGVMGLYDGIGGIDIKGSSYDIASITNTPVIVVVDAKGSGRTVLSTIKGILLDDKNNLIKGVILNRISQRFYDRLKNVFNEEMKEAGFAVKLLGFVPSIKEGTIDSRHLGLVMPDEIEGIRQKLDDFSNQLETSCDIEGIISIMEAAEEILADEHRSNGINAKVSESGKSKSINHYVAAPGCKRSCKKVNSQIVNLAVARDEAFCFYYQENFRCLQEKGVNIVYFSPIHDNKLPDNIQGILLGGGYPELYAEALSQNTSMLSSIRESITKGLPTLAECGGFMYLHDSLTDKTGVEYDLAGVIKGKCFYTGRLSRFGYVELGDNCDICQDDSLMSSLYGMRGHEFHYFDSDNNGEDITIKKVGDTTIYRGMHIGKAFVAGFPHLYYPSAPGFIDSFVECMVRYGQR